MTYQRTVISGEIYYVAEGVYYRRIDRGYQVADPYASTRLAQLEQSADMPRLDIVGREGQSEAQLQADKLACHYAAARQSGYDPAIEGGGVPADAYLARKHDYRRYISACLDERGYTVR